MGFDRGGALAQQAELAREILDMIWQEQRQAAKVPAHAGVVGKNIISLLDGQPTTAEYKGSPEMVIITLGPVRSSVLFWFLRHGS